MKYIVRHLTTCDYDDLVVGSHHSAHLCPRSQPYQRVENFSCVIQPPPNHHNQHQDFHGNTVDDFHIQIAHRQLQVMAESLVEINRPALPLKMDRELNQPWETWVAACQGQWQLQESLQPTALTPSLPQVEQWARQIIYPGMPIYDAIRTLTSTIFREFTYAPGATDVDTAIDQVFSTRSGVCQDFAHVMASALRSLGIPARYVSGYLETLPPPGQQRLIGADASHAWVGVYLPGNGWVDYDPTNDCVVGNAHITVAWGRDYADVPPLKGIIQGGGEHKVSVSVDVQRQG